MSKNTNKVKKMNEKAEKDNTNGEDKANKIENIIMKRLTKLFVEYYYFRSDLIKEIMFNGFGINNNDLACDIFRITKNWIPDINYDVKKIVELLPKYEKVDDVNYVLPKDYWYESKLYTK